MIPPWKTLAIVCAGIAAGLGALVFRISEAPSYLSDRPETCVNCHIMRTQFATWKASSHFAVANCNDCHVPQDTIVRKYLFKSMDGLRHSAMFTLRLEPQAIRIHRAGKRVVQENCIRCHGQLVDGTAMGKLSFTTHDNPRLESAMAIFPAERQPKAAPHLVAEDRVCTDCHRNVPHGDVDSLSSTPEARVQRLNPLGGKARQHLGSQLLQGASGNANQETP